jgi:hypothetical protein
MSRTPDAVEEARRAHAAAEARAKRLLAGAWQAQARGQSITPQQSAELAGASEELEMAYQALRLASGGKGG